MKPSCLSPGAADQSTKISTRLACRLAKGAHPSLNKTSGGVIYLGSGDFEPLPIYPGQNVGDEGGIEVDFLLLELGVAEMEREGLRGGFAGFDGASEKVDG